MSGSSDQALKVWDLLEHGAKVCTTLSGHTASVNAVAVTADRKRAVSGSTDTTLKVWDLEAGQIIATFSVEGALFDCAVTRDGTIVTGGASGQVHCLRLENYDL